MLTLTEIQQALARGYCHAANEKKEVDAVLIAHMAAEVLAALQNSGAVANEPPTTQGDVILLCDYKDHCNWKHIELSNGKTYCMCDHCKTTPVA